MADINESSTSASNNLPLESDPTSSAEINLPSSEQTLTPEQIATSDYVIDHEKEDEILRDLNRPLTDLVPNGSTQVKNNPPISLGSGIKEESISYLDPYGNSVNANRNTSSTSKNTARYTQKDSSGNITTDMVTKFGSGYNPENIKANYFPNGVGNGVPIGVNP